MATKIRLQRHGRKGRPYYMIVVADARAKRDGKFIDKLGFYNPTSIPATIEINRDLALDWLLKGAQPTDTVKAILQYKGVLYKKHLLRGVAKGAFTAEEAEEKFQSWLSDKNEVVTNKKEEHGKKIAAQIKTSVEAGKDKVAAKLKAKTNEEVTLETKEEVAVEEEVAVVEETNDIVAEESETKSNEEADETVADDANKEEQV